MLTHVVVLNLFMFQIVQRPVAGEVKQIGKHGASEINGVPVIPQTKEHVIEDLIEDFKAALA